jgi:hypothetical protein
VARIKLYPEGLQHTMARVVGRRRSVRNNSKCRCTKQKAWFTLSELRLLDSTQAERLGSWSPALNVRMESAFLRALSFSLVGAKWPWVNVQNWNEDQPITSIAFHFKLITSIEIFLWERCSLTLEAI